ncbi:MAG: hypothetical protein AAF934_03030 [Bacteroidota bacterium]
MRRSTPTKARFLFYLSAIALIAVSCGSFQHTSYYGDDLYGSDRVVYRQNVAAEQSVSSSNQSYRDYFAYKSQEYETIIDQPQEEVFTDVDAYSGSYDVNGVSDYGYSDYGNGNGYAGWGGNAVSIAVNVIPNNWGWNNWGWNNWGWNNWGWNNWGWNNWGWNNWGWNNWGWNNWGWNNVYGWNAWAPAGFYCPPVYAYGNPSYRNAVAVNSRRGFYGVTPVNYPISGNVNRASRRSYGNNYTTIPNSYSSRIRNSGVSVKNTRNYNPKRTESYTTRRSNTANYSTRSNTYSTRKANNNTRYNSSARRSNNTSSYNRSSTPRRSSSSSYRSSAPSRSSSNMSRSSSSRSSSGGNRRSGRN